MTPRPRLPLTTLLTLARTYVPRKWRPMLRSLRRRFRPTLSEVVAREPKVNAIFHEPTRNNYVEVFFPRRLNRDEAFARIHLMAEPLNLADGKLLDYFEDFFRKTPGVAGINTISALVQWRAYREKRSFLEGLPSMAELVSHLEERLGEPFSSRLAREAPELILAFCQMPKALERVFRLNLYVPAKEVRRLVTHLCSEVERSPSLLARLERMEIAITDPNTSSLPDFPTVIFYFDEHARDSGSEVPLCEWLQANLTTSSPSPIPTEFAEQWHALATKSEGFRLYKRYLLALGLLDRVYDPVSSYAYAHHSPSTQPPAEPSASLPVSLRSD